MSYYELNCQFSIFNFLFNQLWNNLHIPHGR